MNVAIAQLNPTIGNMSGNIIQILRAAQLAHVAGSSLLVTPELSLTGSPLWVDAVRGGRMREVHEALELLHRALLVPTIVGTPYRNGASVVNGAALLGAGGRPHIIGKRGLSRVERDIFVEGAGPEVVTFAGRGSSSASAMTFTKLTWTWPPMSPLSSALSHSGRGFGRNAA